MNDELNTVPTGKSSTDEWQSILDLWRLDHCFSGYDEQTRFYAGQPWIFEAATAIQSGIIQKKGRGYICRLINDPVTRPFQKSVDLVDTTLSRLDKIVTKDHADPVRMWLEMEIQESRAQGELYGTFIYYPLSNDVYHLATSQAHRLCLLSSNSALLQSSNTGQLSWYDVVRILGKQVIAIAGASVGSMIADTCIKLFRPSAIIIGDPKGPDLSNANRTWYGLEDIGVSKAIGFARQIHKIDPFQRIYLYSEGITKENLKTFLQGNNRQPAATVFIEEIDDVLLKLPLREKARELGLLFATAGDMGDRVVIDIRRFDLNSQLPLCIGISDEALKERVAQQDFFAIAAALVGKENLYADAMGKILQGDLYTPVPHTLPQLGTTVTVASGFITRLITSCLLGDNVPERVVVDINHLDIKSV